MPRSLLGASTLCKALPNIRLAPARRFLSRASAQPRLAFAFDIDGVLKQGGHILPEAKEALQILKRKQVPFILLTNSGGSLESSRAKRLTEELGVPIAEHQIVQSHTIFRALAAQYGDKPILVIGGSGESCRQVAENYGFKHAYIPADIIKWQPSVWPFHQLTTDELASARVADFSKVSFKAVIVFHDSRDWGRDIQMTIDLVRSIDGVIGTAKDAEDPELWTAEKQLPVYFSNPDLLWGSDFPQPRFGQGALQESIAAVYKMLTGYELQRRTGGKPSHATYEYAANLLYSAIDASTTGGPVDTTASKARSFAGRVIMVGDNPKSDIAGANAFGWDSVLVRTGVFRGKGNDREHPATVVLPNVLDGVKWALKREGEDVD